MALLKLFKGLRSIYFSGVFTCDHDPIVIGTNAQGVSGVKFFAILFIATLVFAFNIVPASAVTPYDIEPSLPYGALRGKLQTPEQKKADEVSIIQAQNKLTPSQTQQIKNEDFFRLELITAPLGIDIHSQDNTALKNLLERTWATTTVNISGARLLWRSSRPFEENKDIKDMASPAASSSDQATGFPAAHSAMVYALAGVLSLVDIEWQEQAFTVAKEISDRRHLAGVHYAADIEGGRDLGYMVLGAIAQNAAFRDDLMAARKEYWSKKSQ